MPKIKIQKSDGSTSTYKLIPHKVLKVRKERNVKGAILKIREKDGQTTVSLKSSIDNLGKILNNKGIVDVKDLKNVKPSFSCIVHKTKKSKDLKSKWPAIYDQGNIGSCTANAFCGIFKFLKSQCDSCDENFDPSRLYVYYKERELEANGGPVYDSGAWIIDGYKWVGNNGVCSESSWPYDTTKVNDSPPGNCDDEAKNNTVKGFYQLLLDNNVHNSVSWFLNQDMPIAFAFAVYNSFTTIGEDGICPLPNPRTYDDPNDPIDSFMGGHEVVIMGYDDDKRLYTVANSWGENWGDDGFFYLPYEFLENEKISFDLCVILL
jgi:C1A family cysteine protease